MSIEITCRCGAKLNAKSEWAGKRVKCPTCSETLVVPSASVAAESIRVTCACGKNFRAKASLAGKSLTCPACGKPLPIPTASAPTASPAANAETGLDIDPLATTAASDDPLGLGVAGLDESAFPELPRPTPAEPATGPAATGPAATGPAATGTGSGSGSRAGKPARRKKRGTSTMDVVAGSCAVLHGLIAAYGLVRFLLSVGRTVSVLGPRVFFSLGMVETLISLGASACILMAGIGLLTGERKKALEFGVPASGIYLALVAYRMLALLRISSLLGSPFTARVFGNMIPLMLLSTVGPVLLIYVSRQKAR